MARTTPRPSPTHTQTLQTIVRQCPCCGEPMWAAYHNYRTITTLEAIMRLTLQIRRCLNPACPPGAQTVPARSGRAPGAA
jgi:hypothetical protein